MSSATEEAGGYFTLEHAVLLAVASLILLLSLVTLTHLNAWHWTAHVLRQATTRNTLSQRRSRGIKSRHHRSTASSEQLVGENGDIAHTASGGYRRRVGSERMRRQPRSALKIGYLQRPCRGCKRVEAKKHCEFGFCASCCRVSSNLSCQAHGTGFLAVSTIIESAIAHSYHDLDISYANLRTCPPNVTNVGQQLVTLNLSNNRITSLPDSIGALSGLQELFLQYNYLKKLPASICQLRGLIELDVKNNRLTSLPERLGNLRTLNTLCLTNNQLTALPSSIGKLSDLQELSVHSNALTRLPRMICKLGKLKLFFCGDNKLQHLPDEFGRLSQLEELDLSGCELINLPESFSHCSSLTKLWISNNKLVTLPSKIGCLNSLKELHLRNNCIPFFPKSILRLNLYTFSAQGNPTLSDHQARQASRHPTQPFPSLLELAARTVVNRKICWVPKTLPTHLEVLLSRPVYCSDCGGPAFTHFTSSITFHTVGTYYWLPLLQLNCSPHRQGNCRPTK